MRKAGILTHQGFSKVLLRIIHVEEGLVATPSEPGHPIFPGIARRL